MLLNWRFREDQGDEQGKDGSPFLPPLCLFLPTLDDNIGMLTASSQSTAASRLIICCVLAYMCLNRAIGFQDVAFTLLLDLNAKSDQSGPCFVLHTYVATPFFLL
jgi:hypothetical protein